MSKCQAVVAYCDVTGFMAFVQRASAAQMDVVPFIQRMKFLFRRFRVETGYFVIPIGDGIIALITEGDCGKRVGTIALLESSIWLQQNMQRLIATTKYPRPGGFRVRVTAGVVFRTVEPPIVGLSGPTTDFIGDAMNLGARLCEVSRKDPLIIHESAIEIMTTPEKKQLILKPVLVTDEPPKGVHQDDMKGLWTFQLKRSAGE